MISSSQRRLLLGDLLKGVSRSFYLSIRVLPGGLRRPVGLAYLLARAADTIADSGLVPPAQRLEHLLSFRRQVKGPAEPEAVRLIVGALTDRQAIPEERLLLSALPSAFTLLESTLEPDRSLVQSVVATLTQGMETDLTTFPAEDSGRLAAFRTPDELDRYTYHVAGCVGGVLDFDHHGPFGSAATVEWGADARNWSRFRQGVAVDECTKGRAKGPAHRTLLLA